MSFFHTSNPRTYLETVGLEELKRIYGDKPKLLKLIGKKTVVDITIGGSILTVLRDHDNSYRVLNGGTNYSAMKDARFSIHTIVRKIIFFHGHFTPEQEPLCYRLAEEAGEFEVSFDSHVPCRSAHFTIKNGSTFSKRLGINEVKVCSVTDNRPSHSPIEHPLYALCISKTSGDSLGHGTKGTICHIPSGGSHLVVCKIGERASKRCIEELGKRLEVPCIFSLVE